MFSFVNVIWIEKQRLYNPHWSAPDSLVIRSITEQAYQRTWERISRTINLHGATAHVFRHTFATIAAPYLDIKTLQTIMGHADIETTLDRYTHAQEERIRAAGELLTGKFNSSNS